MRLQGTLTCFAGAAVVLAALSLLVGRAQAHCDGMDGPVVKAAERALEAGDPSPALVWVKAGDEAAIRAAFAQALAVRGLSPQARELADRYFLETLVRLHRAGEGAPFSGLKPAGRDLGPAIPAADRALQTGDADALVELLTGAAARGTRERFQRVLALRDYDPKEVEKGREYVEAYVSFVHYVENVYRSTQSPAHGHAPEAAAGDEHERGR